MENENKILIMNRKLWRRLFFSICIMSNSVGVLWLFYIDKYFGELKIVLEYGPLFEGFLTYIWLVFIGGFIFTVHSLLLIARFTDKMEKNLENYVQSIKVQSLNPKNGSSSRRGN